MESTSLTIALWCSQRLFTEHMGIRPKPFPTLLQEIQQWPLSATLRFINLSVTPGGVSGRLPICPRKVFVKTCCVINLVIRRPFSSRSVLPSHLQESSQDSVNGGRCSYAGSLLPIGTLIARGSHHVFREALMVQVYRLSRQIRGLLGLTGRLGQLMLYAWVPSRFPTLGLLTASQSPTFSLGGSPCHLRSSIRDAKRAHRGDQMDRIYFILD